MSKRFNISIGVGDVTPILSKLKIPKPGEMNDKIAKKIYDEIIFELMLDETKYKNLIKELYKKDELEENKNN